MIRWLVAALLTPLLACAASTTPTPRDQPGSFCPPVLAGGPLVEWTPGPQPEILSEDADRGSASILKSHIQAAIRRDINGIKLCYECAWTRTNRPGSVFTPRFAIAPDGSVAALELVENDFDAKTTECLERVVRGLRFTPPDGDGYVVVTYPFRFSAIPAPG